MIRIGSSRSAPTPRDGLLARHARPYGAAGLLLMFLALVAPALAQQSEKAKTIGKRMLCMCGCNQILTECNHVGCTTSAQMLRELDDRVARNEPDDLMIQSFVQEYGERVLVMPQAKGFNRTVWIMPVAFSLGGVLLVYQVATHWRRRAAAAPTRRVSAEFLARAKREADAGPED